MTPHPHCSFECRAVAACLKASQYSFPTIRRLVPFGAVAALHCLLAASMRSPILKSQTKKVDPKQKDFLPC